MYVPYIGHDAAVYFLEQGSEVNSRWTIQKLFNMPFVLRLAVFERDNRRCLFVATVSKHKDSPDDWRNPGELYVVDATHLTTACS
jgi:hypothetical protein